MAAQRGKWQVLGGLGGAAALGIGTVLTFAARSGSFATAAAVGLMVAAAAAVTGGLFGFLFGIPRARATDATDAAGDYRPNTNLEQVSDWLTKILLGAGLAQLGALRAAGGDLVGAIAPSFGTAAAAAPFAGALLVYHLVVGFLAGWLLTSLFLGRALTEAARAAAAADVLREAQDAEDAGNPERAAELRLHAMDLVGHADAVAARYNEIRTTRTKGPDRSAALHEMIFSAYAAAYDQRLTRQVVRERYERGTEGDRVYALAVLSRRPDLGDADLLAAAFDRAQSNIETQEALRAVLAAAPVLSAADRARLADVVRARADEGSFRPGGSRDKLAAAALAALAGGPPE